MTQIDFWREQAEDGDLESIRNLFFSFNAGENGVEEDQLEAFRWALKLAESGDASFMGVTAKYYREGLDRLPKDLDQAFYWDRKGAALGDVGCMYGLAILYGTGEGVAPDPAKKEYWEKRALARWQELEPEDLYYQEESYDSEDEETE